MEKKEVTLDEDETKTELDMVKLFIILKVAQWTPFTINRYTVEVVSKRESLKQVYKT